MPSEHRASARNVTQRGAKFYRDGAAPDEVLFVNHIDASTRDGPRAASEADAEAFPEAWQGFLADERAFTEGRKKQMARWERELTPEEIASAEPPFRPLLSFRDPEGGKPPREKGVYERKRDQALARGEVA